MTQPELPDGIKAGTPYPQYEFAHLPRPACPVCGRRLGYRPKVASEPGGPIAVRIAALMCSQCGTETPLT
ncbi:MAG: hypothetical protein WCA46_25890 [Actinocatenispora sp.]